MRNATTIFIFTLIVFLIFLPSYMKMQDLRSKNIKYQNEVLKLEQDKEKLSEELRRLKEDPVYLEKVARDKLGVAKDGEVIYKLSPDEEIR